MFMPQQTVVGLDIGRLTAYACPLSELPVDLLEFSRSYKFKRFTATATDLADLAELGDIFVLEPTGADHRVWVDNLKRAGKIVLGVTGTRIRSYARNAGILNKADREDAAVIAAYALANLQRANLKAFISIDASIMRENFLQLMGLKAQRVALINTLRARLAYEVPELASLQCKKRDWGSPNTEALYRVIAGREVPKSKIATLPKASIGRGLSPVSIALAEQILGLDQLMCAIELDVEAILDRPEFKAYRAVFDRWKLPTKSALPILAATYPIDQYLDENLNPVRKKVYSTSQSKNTRTSRDRSLKSFKRAIGAGMMRIQSGKKDFQAPTGDRRIRAAIYVYLESAVFIRRTLTRQVIFKHFPEEKERFEANKSPKAKKALLARYSLKNMAQHWIETHELSGSPMWKHPILIDLVTEMYAASPRIAELMLFIDLAPQCQNKPKKEILMKVYPRFVTMLFKDLAQEIQLNKGQTSYRM